MAVASPSPADPELEHTAWDLQPLVDGAGDEGARAQLAQALQRAQAFAKLHAGKVTEIDATTLEQAMRELAEIQELAGRAGTYAGLRFSVDTSDPAGGALLQEVQERATEIETTLLFFELEWAALVRRARRVRCSPTSAWTFCAHHLATCAATASTC